MKYIKPMNDHYFYGDPQEDNSQEQTRTLAYLPAVIKQEMTATLKDDYSSKVGSNSGEDFAFHANLIEDFIDPAELKSVAKLFSRYKTIEELTNQFKSMLLKKFLAEKGITDTYSYGKNKGVF